MGCLNRGRLSICGTSDEGDRGFLVSSMQGLWIFSGTTHLYKPRLMLSHQTAKQLIV